MAIKFLNTATGITEAAGDNSTKIATTAYVDAAAAAVPIGDYVTLATAQTISGAKTFNNDVTLNNTYLLGVDKLEANQIVIGTSTSSILGNVGIGTTSPTSLLEISKQLSAASTIDYPYTISSRDDGNSINQAGGEGVGIKFRIAGNAATTPGDSLVGASIAAIRESASDTDSSTGLGFFVTQNDETLDEALRIDHDGNVGIGTPSPSEKLEVTGNVILDVANARLKIKGGITGTNSGIDFTFNTDSTSYAKMELDYDTRASTGLLIDSGYPMTLDYSSGSFSVKRNGSSELTILNGNVGIGTTSPDAKLDVEAATNPTIRLTNSTNPLGGADVGTLEFFTKDTSTQASRVLSSIVCVNEANSPSVPDGQLAFKTSLGGANAQPATEKMRIDPIGRIGIGTVSPVDALDVDWDEEGVATDLSGIRVRAYRPHLNLIDRSGYSTSNGHNFQIKADSAKLQFNATSADNETFDLTRMVIDKDGNVGIGTDSPTTSYSKALQIHASGNGSTLRLTDSVSSSSIGSGLELLQYGIDSYIINRESGPMYFLTSSTTQMTILANGNVGIGLTDPDSRLDINAGVSNVVNGPAVRISKGASPIGLIRYDTVVIEANDVATIRIGESDGTVSTIMSGDNNLRINSTDPIKFYTAGTPGGEGHAGQGGTFAMIIDNSQNVGIGTTSPDEKLQVAGDMFLSNSSSRIAIGENITGTPYKGYADGKNGPGQLVVAGYASSSQFPGVMTLMNRDSSISANQDLGVIQFVGKDDGSSGYCSSQIIGTSASAPGSGNTGGGTLRFLTNPGGTGANIEERLRIASNGNVGIGDTSPSAKLSVNGGVQVANDTATASAANVGTIRYRVSGNNSYVDMCMQTGATTYAWVNIVQNNW